MNIELPQCPATRTLVALDYCRACDQHVDGVGCPALSRVVPKVYCLTECVHSGDDLCGKSGKPHAETWDSEAMLCSYPRRIQTSTMRVEV